jgi:hypothetical protein
MLTALPTCCCATPAGRPPTHLPSALGCLHALKLHKPKATGGLAAWVKSHIGCQETVQLGEVLAKALGSGVVGQVAHKQTVAGCRQQGETASQVVALDE